MEAERHLILKEARQFVSSERNTSLKYTILAMNKLEKVALRSARRTGRPLVLILNNIHFFKNDDDGRNMLLQLQQRAEAWAASGVSSSFSQARLGDKID